MVCYILWAFIWFIDVWLHATRKPWVPIISRYLLNFGAIEIGAKIYAIQRFRWFVAKEKTYELLALLFVSYFLNLQSKQGFCRMKACCLWYEALGIPCKSTVGYSKFSRKMLRMLTFMLMLNMQYNCRIEIFHCYVSYICKIRLRS